MHDASARELEEVRRKLAEVAEQLGRLTVTHGRLREDHRRLAPEPDPDDTNNLGMLDEDPLPAGRSRWNAETLDQRDRDGYAEAIRDRLYRTLYALDFTLVHGTLDRLMLGDARAAVVDAIDSADAWLMVGAAMNSGSDSTA